MRLYRDDDGGKRNATRAFPYMCVIKRRHMAQPLAGGRFESR